MDRRAEILEFAERVFGNADKAELRLSAPKRALEGRTPMDMLETEISSFRVKEVLIQLAKGHF